MLTDTLERGTLVELRTAIQRAEACGIDTYRARKQYCELARQERHSVEHVQDMMRWALSTRDGGTLYAVIQEVQDIAPDHPDLKIAKAKLLDLQDEVRVRIQWMVKQRDARGIAMALDRFRQMGTEPSELSSYERQLRDIEDHPSRNQQLARAAHLSAEADQLQAAPRLPAAALTVTVE